MSRTPVCRAQATARSSMHRTSLLCSRAGWADLVGGVRKLCQPCWLRSACSLLALQAAWRVCCHSTGTTTSGEMHSPDLGAVAFLQPSGPSPTTCSSLAAASPTRQQLQSAIQMTSQPATSRSPSHRFRPQGRRRRPPSSMERGHLMLQQARLWQRARRWVPPGRLSAHVHTLAPVHGRVHSGCCFGSGSPITCRSSDEMHADPCCAWFAICPPARVFPCSGFWRLA